MSYRDYGRIAIRFDKTKYAETHKNDEQKTNQTC